MKTKYFVKETEFDGMPKLSDFKLVEENIDDNLADGEILTETLCISVDPYIRFFPVPPGSVIPGLQTARVLKSKNEKYPEGAVVMQNTTWSTICKTNGDQVWHRVDNIRPTLEISKWLGAAGMPGITAYYGLLDICNPKEGETVMVNSCAGTVGSIVGQIAKAKGCRVIGCCGSDEKIAFVKSIGFDDAFNYKTESWPEALKRIAPNGIDCYFDNVGGQLSSDVFEQMNIRGRVTVCGYLSSYNSKEKAKADILQPAIVFKQLRIQGIAIFDESFYDKYFAAAQQLAKWIHEGKIVARETVIDGFENMPKAFIDMLSGKNVGKTAVRP